MKEKPIPNILIRSVLVEKAPARIRIRIGGEAIISYNVKRWVKNEFSVHKCVSYEEFYKGLKKAGRLTFNSLINSDMPPSDFYVISSGRKKGFLIHKEVIERCLK